MEGANMRIIAGIDLNTNVYGWLVRKAAFFATYMDATLDLFFVLASHQESHRAKFQKELEGVLQQLPETHRGKAIIATGNPVDTLVEKAKDYDALVVGPREPGAFEALLFGSIASRVVKKSQCAVFTPRTNDEEKEVTHRVLLAVDVTRHEAVQYGERIRPWISCMKAKADILYADPQALPHIPDPKIRERALAEWQAARKDDLQQLNHFLATYLAEDAKGVIRLEQGDPADVLVRVSHEYDLIVVGSRPRPGLSGVVFGSVASQLVREADCDILTLPTLEFES
jgi:nucleotide-binding universal stress UspA family protein